MSSSFHNFFSKNVFSISSSFLEHRKTLFTAGQGKNVLVPSDEWTETYWINKGGYFDAAQYLSISLWLRLGAPSVFPSQWKQDLGAAEWRKMYHDLLSDPFKCNHSSWQAKCWIIILNVWSLSDAYFKLKISRSSITFSQCFIGYDQWSS